MTPAYDLTYSDTYYGEHTTTINGKGDNITKEDLLFVGKQAGLNCARAKNIIDEIEEIVRHNLKGYLS